MRRLWVLLLSTTFFLASFALGAIWVHLRAWPYDALRQVDLVALIKRNVVGSRTPVEQIDSAYSIFNLDSFQVARRVSRRVERGGIDAIGDDVLVVSSAGDLYLYHHGPGDKSIQRLNVETNGNHENAHSYAMAHGLQGEAGNRVDTYFGFIDVLYVQEPSSSSIVLSHVYWHPEQHCFDLRLSRLSLEPGDTLTTVNASAEDWSTLYETTPCLTLEEGHYLELMGGRIARAEDGSILFTVGSLDRYGAASGQPLAQDDHADYGKVLRIDPGTGAATQLTRGHRNTQGLLVDDDGNIWVTEHGPKGGDELNRLESGGNYGWPLVTYGTSYTGKRWSRSRHNGYHDGFVRPVYAFVPSIGISNLIQVHNSIPEWEGDLLVSSLKQSTMYRLRYREGRVVVAEPIRVNVRIRDIDQLANGAIVLWTDTAVISEVSPAVVDETDGDEALADYGTSVRQHAASAIESCMTCHSVSRYAGDSGAPTLAGLFGRPIGEGPFTGYSRALKQHGGVWNEATLDEFLTDPARFAEGTSMVVPGIDDQQTRQAVIAYLRSLESGPI